MYCGQGTLVKHSENLTAAKVLRCRSWQCETCRPGRARELIAMASKGKPNKFLTLTVSEASGKDPLERCHNLVKAWRAVRLEIAANLAIPEYFRWDAVHHCEHRKVRGLMRAAMKDKETMRKHAVEFLAVVEAQGSGEPHLHIICRMPYIPQAWIAQQMDRRIGAPICWIEAVYQTRKLANYVAKYCGKNPHRFGTLKRYWQSVRWLLVPKEKKERWRIGDPTFSRSEVSIEEHEVVAHNWATIVWWEGKWLLSSYAFGDEREERSCEFAGCKFPHHKGAFDED